MNCKKGDIAIVVFSEGVNIGKIVECVRFVPMARFLYPDGSHRYFDAWEIDPPLIAESGGTTIGCPDAWLRPIRDSDGTDEILLKAGKPRANDLAPKRQVEFAR
jgi:hypothetical protein